jgi:hypothetical protein
MQPHWKKQNLNKNVLQQTERYSRLLHARKRLERQQKGKPERKLNVYLPAKKLLARKLQNKLKRRQKEHKKHAR